MGQNYSLTPDDLRQLNVQTNFSEEDIRKFYDDFIRDFPSGKVTKEDVRSLYRKIFPTGDPSAIVEQIFRTYDVDKNDMVDFREFLCGVGVVTNGTDGQRLRLAFRIFDQDQSGFICRDEYHAIFTGLYKAMGVFYGQEDKVFESESFEQLDKNRDAKISYDEFESHAKRDPVVLRLMKFDHPETNDVVDQITSPNSATTNGTIPDITTNNTAFDNSSPQAPQSNTTHDNQGDSLSGDQVSA